MIFLSVLIFILAISLPFFKTQITPIFFTRIAALAFIYAGMLTFNTLHILPLGSGIGIYCDFFQVTYFSLFIETFLYVVGALILLSWPLLKSNTSNYLNYIQYIEKTKDRNIQYFGSTKEEEEFPNTSLSTLSLPYRSDIGSIDKVFYSKTRTNFDRVNYLQNSFINPELTGIEKRENEGIEKNDYLPLYLASREVVTEENTVIMPLTGLGNESKEYSLIALFSTLGGSLLISSGDLLSMYLSIELQSFGLYVLATIYRDSGSATSAGLKYFLLGGLSSCLILLGASLIYSFTGLTNFESIYTFLSVLSLNNSSTYFDGDIINTGKFLIEGGITQGISLGVILIVVGFLFKISGAPFHNWAPDVYDDSPTNVTIWLTLMPKISIIIFLLELVMGISSQFSHSIIESLSITTTELPNISIYTNIGLGESAYVLKNVFLLSSLLSLIIGTIVGLAQIRIKRLLAYSTISHIGFLLLALSINTEQSTESLILYLIQYILTSLNTFFILLAFGYIINSTIFNSRSLSYNTENEGNFTSFNSDINYIFDLKGQFLFNPLLSISFAICLFSMAGIPPLIGFFGKLSVLYAAIANGNNFMALIAIIVSVISAYYYLRIIKELYSETSFFFLHEIKVKKDKLGASLILTNIHSFIIATLTLLILLFILKPSILLNSTVLLSLSLFNG